jgi:hypothetical protein
MLKLPIQGIFFDKQQKIFLSVTKGAAAFEVR